MAKILITGGAGYIGSHIVALLAGAGYRITVLDNLSSGCREAVLAGRLVEGDVADRPLLDELLQGEDFAAVIHMAASIQVEESVRRPLFYYHNNVANTINLLQAMADAGVKRLVFSSTASVYGMPGTGPVAEDAPIAPVNPYGHSKAMVEQILADQAAAGRLSYISLRYFNVAGADPGGRLGQRGKEATHLIKRGLLAANGQLPGLQIFGTDYDTPDGTCLRDYIHVSDLAAAHELALQSLLQQDRGGVFNLGYGHGFSVREVVAAVQRVSGVRFPVAEAPRRAGDPAVVVADSSRIRNQLGWQPHHDDIDFIVRSAWEWEQSLG